MSRFDHPEDPGPRSWEPPVSRERPTIEDAARTASAFGADWPRCIYCSVPVDLLNAPYDPYCSKVCSIKAELEGTA